jgi:SAM-dependent methyltransferase
MTRRQLTPERSVSAIAARQFGSPSGLAGHVVTLLLARGNARFNRWLVNELSAALPVPHTVMELGYGPGVALQEMVNRHPVARVIGIDPSPVAQTTARRRNAAAIKAGRLELVSGDVQAAVACGPADLIVACHVLYFWTDPVGELRRAREALAPCGHLALGYQLRQHMPPISQRSFPPQGFILYDSDDQVAAVLQQAGFASPEIRVLGALDRPLGRLALSVPALPQAPGNGQPSEDRGVPGQSPASADQSQAGLGSSLGPVDAGFSERTTA